jgi:poly(A) polymerase/tRNA nucleotidyltransferase (CCA-adding enzyme)
MELSLPVEVLFILFRLQQADAEAFLVGGATRDLFLGKKAEEIKDFDFASNFPPEQLQKVFPKSFYENRFGTVSIPYKYLLAELNSHYQVPEETLYQVVKKRKSLPNKSERVIDIAQAKKIHNSLLAPTNTETKEDPDLIFPPFEITTYRCDGLYTDYRRPESVTWGKTLQEDLQRRDFTINAFALRVKMSFLEKVFHEKILKNNYILQEKEYELIDYHQGKIDLEKKLIRTVGDPDRRFQEDALRMIRAIRLAVELEFDIETNSFFAIQANHHLFSHVSAERIRDEFLRILSSARPAHGVLLLDQLGLLEFIIPELVKGKNMQQRGHHTTDVWTHSLAALETCPSFDPIVRLAALIHDIGKPLTYHEENGQITFYNHEIVGSRVASKLAQRLRLSRKDSQRLFILVRYHMFYYQPEHSDASIRRFMRKVGLENVDDMLDLREADRLGSGSKKTSWRLEEMKKRMIEQLNQPMDVTDLAINGNDLMQEFQLKPSPILGELLHFLFEKVLDEPERNSKESLFDLAASYLKNENSTQTKKS